MFLLKNNSGKGELFWAEVLFWQLTVCAELLLWNRKWLCRDGGQLDGGRSLQVETEEKPLTAAELLSPPSAWEPGLLTGQRRIDGILPVVGLCSGSVGTGAARSVRLGSAARLELPGG